MSLGARYGVDNKKDWQEGRSVQGRHLRQGGLRVSKTFMTKESAEKWARQRETEFDRKGLIVDTSEASETTLSALIARYVKDVTPKRRTVYSASVEQLRLEKMAKHALCKKVLLKLQPRDFERYQRRQTV